MKKNYYLLSEILWGMKEYFRDLNKYDYLKKFLQIDKERYIRDANELYFYLSETDKRNGNRDLLIGGASFYIIGKDENNNYIIGSPSSRHATEFYPVIYQSKTGDRVFDDDFGICINPEMMKQFHEEYNKLTNSVDDVRDYEINLGHIDDLPNVKITISRGMFAFLSGHFAGTPQYEKDPKRFSIYYGNLDSDIFVIAKKVNENVLNLLIKVLAIKVPKKFLHEKHQEMIEKNCASINPEQIISNIIEMVTVIDNNTLINDPPKKLTLK